MTHSLFLTSSIIHQPGSMPHSVLLFIIYLLSPETQKPKSPVPRLRSGHALRNKSGRPVVPHPKGDRTLSCNGLHVLVHQLFLQFPLETSDKEKQIRLLPWQSTHARGLSQLPWQAEWPRGPRGSQPGGKHVAQWLRAQAVELSRLGHSPRSVVD